MAQKIYVENNVPLVSFDENQRWLGVLEPGIYRGFDSANFVGNVMTLDHLTTGVLKTDIDGTGQSNRTAVLLSRQGSIVHEDEAIDLVVDYNEGNSEQRIDYVIGEHTYQNSPGGVDMAFSIIKGPLNSQNEPVLSNALTQVLIGKVYIPAGAASHTSSTYVRVQPPGLGNFNKAPKSDDGTVEVVEEADGFDLSIQPEIDSLETDIEEVDDKTVANSNKIITYSETVVGLSNIVTIPSGEVTYDSGDNDVRNMRIGEVDIADAKSKIITVDLSALVNGDDDLVVGKINHPGAYNGMRIFLKFPTNETHTYFAWNIYPGPPTLSGAMLTFGAPNIFKDGVILGGSFPYQMSFGGVFAAGLQTGNNPIIGGYGVIYEYIYGAWTIVGVRTRFPLASGV